MDDYMLALIVIGDMTLTERKLRMQLADAEKRIAELTPEATEESDNA